MTEENPIVLGVDILKKILEFLPRNYSVSIAIEDTIFPVQTFDINDDYEEIILKWHDLDYTKSHRESIYVGNIRGVPDLIEENRRLKDKIKEYEEMMRND